MGWLHLGAARVSCDRREACERARVRRGVALVAVRRVTMAPAPLGSNLVPGFAAVARDGEAQREGYQVALLGEQACAKNR